ncbi:MAG: hypothetical protein AAF511_01090, partial [Pseudomonadota bacterium]
MEMSLAQKSIVESVGKSLALIAVLVLALTGGTMHVDLSTEVPTVTICSAHGSYEVPLDIGYGPDEAVFDLCCGACVAVDAPDPIGGRPWTPFLHASSRDVLIAIAAQEIAGPLWRQP